MLKAVVIFTVVLACIYAEQRAVVYVSDPTGASKAKGVIIFTKEEDGSITINGNVTELNQGEHGFHIHNLGLIAPDCNATGVHFNPHNASHGGPDDSERHVGDLGNVSADEDGTAKVNFTDVIIDLEGEHSIIGRSLVVHADVDDLGKGNYSDSLTTGHAGLRVACGIIGILEDDQPGGAHQATSGNLIIIGALMLIYRLGALL